MVISFMMSNSHNRDLSQISFRLGLRKERILYSPDFHFLGRGESCISTSLVENWNPFYWEKLFHFFYLFFAWNKVSHQTIEGWVVWKIRTILIPMVNSSPPTNLPSVEGLNFWQANQLATLNFYSYNFNQLGWPQIFFFFSSPMATIIQKMLDNSWDNHSQFFNTFFY